jgi:hypothetical protein
MLGFRAPQRKLLFACAMTLAVTGCGSEAPSVVSNAAGNSTTTPARLSQPKAWAVATLPPGATISKSSELAHADTANASTRKTQDFWTCYNSMQPGQGCTYTPGDVLLVHDSSPNGQIVTSIPDGTLVTFVCQTQPQDGRWPWVDGPWGWTNVWDSLHANRSWTRGWDNAFYDAAFVSDAYVYTGSMGLVAPACA